MKEDFPGAALGPRRARFLRAAAALACVMAVAAGCANRESIVVGSIPDDYRTSHPITIAEQQVALDIPVGQHDRGPGRVQSTALSGFLTEYDRQTAPAVTMLVPSGGMNHHAAASVAAGLIEQMHRAGVPKGNVIRQHYQANASEQAPPIRVSYPKMKASAGPCGRWPNDMLDNADNRHWANFGCSYQSNLAAQIANPADLLAPRRPSPVDAEHRTRVLNDYRLGQSDWNSEVDY